MSRMRIAVVGAGTIGAVHARAVVELADRAELVAVADIDPARSARLAAVHGVASQAPDVVLGRPDVDAVSVCVPSGRHADVAVAALRAGKHVVVEKPIEVTLAAADRIVDAERATGATVAVISQHRFDAATERVVESVRAGRLGTVTSVVVSHPWWRGQSYYDSGEWRGTRELDGGGATMNQTVHTIDLMVGLLGTPVEVFAYTARLAHERIDVEDTAVAVVRFAGGALGLVHATTAAYPGMDASLRIHGSRGSAVISGDRLAFLHETDGEPAEIAMSDGEGADQRTAADRVDPAELAFGRAHRRQLADFVDAVRTGAPVRVGTGEARAALSVVLAMYESAASGAPVQLRG